MLFPSYTFLFLFLPSLLVAQALLPRRHHNWVLTVASYVFYAYWDYRFCSLILISTYWDYQVGSALHATQTQSRRKLLLWISVAFNLALLGYFKYANFFVDTFNDLFPDAPIPALNVILPIGISFFTFQSMSYTIDIYRKQITPTRSFIAFACYISMFPQLIAGPIVRFYQIASQLEDRCATSSDLAHGIRQFTIGLAKKVLIADACGLIADTLFATESPAMATAWLATTAYSLQIYFDFAGYSDMAIGLGRMFGFTIPHNFNFPYQAKSITEFWRRWHISLSGWFREYLYIPLGGSRASAPRVAANLMITMLLCGLWHGASWTFVVWGGYHGLLLAAERPVLERIRKIPAFIALPITTVLVMVGWVLFRSDSLTQAGHWLLAMAGQSGITDQAPQFPSLTITAIVGIYVACWLVPQRTPDYSSGARNKDLLYLLLFATCTAVILGSQSSPFLYYQF